MAFVRSLVEDLRRRDFTINAIAYDPLSDRWKIRSRARPTSGAGLIRAVGDPAARFGEDGLRALRAVRFAAQLGFVIDPPTLAAIEPSLPCSASLGRAGARRAGEILSSERPSVGLELMQVSGLLGEVIPELLEGVGLSQDRFHAHDVWHHTLAAVDATVCFCAGAGLDWRLGALLHDVAKPRTAAPKEGAPGERTFFRHELVGAEMAEAICRRLKLSTHEREHVVNLVKNHMFWYTPDWTDGTVRRFISRVGEPALDDLFALRAGDVRARGRGEEPASEIMPSRCASMRSSRPRPRSR